MTLIVGRMMYARVHPEANNGSDFAPALVTRVNDDGTVNLKVSLDTHGELRQENVKVYQSVSDLPTAVDDGQTAAYWPTVDNSAAVAMASRIGRLESRVSALELSSGGN